jgi:uncharacterized membrane-anchored protein YitT (DUF2179 family)
LENAGVTIGVSVGVTAAVGGSSFGFCMVALLFFRRKKKPEDSELAVEVETARLSTMMMSYENSSLFETSDAVNPLFEA